MSYFQNCDPVINTRVDTTLQSNPILYLLMSASSILLWLRHLSNFFLIVRSLVVQAADGWALSARPAFEALAKETLLLSIVEDTM